MYRHYTTQKIRDMHADATSAYHRLNTGAAERVFVDQSGERIEYTAAKVPELRRYCEELSSELSARQNPRAVRRGPIRPLF